MLQQTFVVFDDDVHDVDVHDVDVHDVHDHRVVLHIFSPFSILHHCNTQRFFEVLDDCRNDSA
jgi:hypothetical protein